MTLEGAGSGKPSACEKVYARSSNRPGKESSVEALGAEEAIYKSSIAPASTAAPKSINQHLARSSEKKSTVALI